MLAKTFMHIRLSAFVASSFILLVSSSDGQEIYDQKEAERVYRQSILESRYNKLYFDEIDRCRKLQKEEKYREAEASCKRAIGHSEKLPKERHLERSSGYIGVGIAQLRQRRFPDAIANFQKALEIGQPYMDDTNSETGDIYFLLGQAYHLAKDVPSARSFYERAEKTYRAAFRQMEGDEFFVVPYALKIRAIVETHVLLVEGAELDDAIVEMNKRLNDVDREFSKYLLSN